MNISVTAYQCDLADVNIEEIMDILQAKLRTVGDFCVYNDCPLVVSLVLTAHSNTKTNQISSYMYFIRVYNYSIRSILQHILSLLLASFTFFRRVIKAFVGIRATNSTSGGLNNANIMVGNGRSGFLSDNFVRPIVNVAIQYSCLESIQSYLSSFSSSFSTRFEGVE